MGRHLDPGTTLEEYAEPEVLVACPRCSALATVRRGEGRARRLTCGSCALVRDADGATSRNPTRGAPMSALEELPGWLTSASDRDDVLAVLDRLALTAP